MHSIETARVSTIASIIVRVMASIGMIVVWIAVIVTRLPTIVSTKKSIPEIPEAQVEIKTWTTAAALKLIENICCWTGSFPYLFTIYIR